MSELSVSISVASNTVVLCPYCQQPTEQTSGKKMYPLSQRLAERIFYVCWPCDACVGTHKKTGKPLGAPANKALGALRIETHDCFDTLWQRGFLSRSKAYRWLSKVLQIPKEECHIAMFNEVTCRKIIDLCKRFAVKRER